MKERNVPVAYVTRWAATRGILVVKDGEAHAYDSGTYLKKGHLFVSAKEWTEDKAVAEGRYRAALRRALNSAEEKVKRIQAALDAPPKYEGKP